jgi:hypothetical protein
MDTGTRVEAHSPEWYMIRRGLFTASRLYELINTPKEKPRPYIIEKVAEILTGESQESDYISEDMAHGVEYEPHAIKWWSKLTGLRVAENSEFVKHGIMRFGATPDRVAYDEQGNKIVLEVKCPKSKTHVKYCLIKDREEFKKKLPKYYWQGVGGAICTGADHMAFISFDPRIDRDCGLFHLIFQIPDEDIKTAYDAIIAAEKELNDILTKLK